ncbi:hypothetical protein Tco_1494711 [Tanacetum coccineum]
MHTDKDLEEPAHQEFDIGATEEQSDKETSHHPNWFQKPAKHHTPDRDWKKTLPSFDKLTGTPFDFSAFVMNRLKVETLTPELLAGLTFELMKGTCKSLVELEYFFEDVYKATTEQLDWHNPEGQQYPHEDNFKRLRLQDIEDMLLLLVQGKLTNINVEERVESYQKKLNITKPDSYRSDLKRKEAYSAYSNPRGFIYQNRDKKNKLMRVDELHKFSDGTLNDVQIALDDHLKGIRMGYLPKTIWRQSDRERAKAMI